MIARNYARQLNTPIK